MARERLSIILITKNEEAKIARCLESVRFADEVMVVDGESTDRTAELCRAAGARVIVHAFSGYFARERNLGVEAATGDWMLQLDADETVSDGLRVALQHLLEARSPHAAFQVRRLNTFLGRTMRHGGWYHHNLALFHRSRARYDLNVRTHERLIVDGTIGVIEADLDHRPFDNVSQVLERHNRYTSMQAQDMWEADSRPAERLLRREMLWRPLKLFWKSYVKKQGWREGTHGLAFAMLFAWLHFLKWAKYWERTLPPPETPAGEPSSGAAVPRLPLSVVVLTKNEERRIGRCLESVRWADEIIVVDGESTDRTAEIARSFGATVITHPFDGSFATDRNLGLQHARHPWVLQIDADDIVTPGFREAVKALLARDPSEGALAFYRRSVLLGRSMAHGGWRYTVPNLLHKERARYEGLVHERPVVQGATGHLEAEIEHHPCEDLAVFVARQNRYTTLQAQEMFQRLGRLPERNIRRRLVRAPLKTFWKSYVKKQGRRDGMHGLVFALLFAGVDFIKWMKYWELTLPPHAP